MPVIQPEVNEYQRTLVAALNNVTNRNGNGRLPALIFRELPPYRQTAITEWGACLYGKTGDIKAKTSNGLVTFYTRRPVLDWAWLERMPHDWVCCPQCGRVLPKEPRYWHWRNRSRGYLWLDACRDCKCRTEQRWGERKRTRLANKSSCLVHD